MRKQILLLVLTVGIITAPTLFAQNTAGEKRTTGSESSDNVDFNAGLIVSLNNTAVEMGDENIKNSLAYYFLAMELDVDLLDNLTLGILAGLNNNYFTDPVDFFQFPVPLRFNEEKSNSMVMGLNARSELLLPGDFSLQGRAGFLYFKLHKNTFAFDPPDVTGDYTMKNSFVEAFVELRVQYDGFSGLTIYAGPQLNLLHGKFSASETADTVDASASYTYDQKQTVGVVGGVNLDLGDHFVIDAKLTLISKTALSAGIFYVF